MNEWKKVKLGDMVDSCLGKMLDAEKNCGDYQPYLANINVRWGGFELTNLSKMKFEPSESERYGIKDGDLIICEGGEPGRCAIWREQIPNMKIQKALHRVRVKNGLDVRYLYYWLLLAGKTGRLGRYFTGSTIKHLPGDNLSEIEMDLPKIGNQRAIGTVLNNIDRKIALNNAISAELENMAKLLYDYWFVQFDFPNIEGKLYRASGGEMEWSEELKCKIPKGWNPTALNKICDISSGYPFSSDSYTKSGNYKLITIKNVQENGVNLDVDNYIDSIPDNMPDYCNLKIGDILMSLTGNVGRVGIMFSDKCLLNQRVAFINQIIPNINHYLYFTFKDDYLKTKLELMALGSSQDNLSPVETGFLRIAFDKKTAQNFNAKIHPFMQKIISNLQENTYLAELRDFLLPLLMNGQVTVASAEIVAAPTTEVISTAASNVKAKQAVVFKRLVLSAYILDNICDEPTAGRVKFEKLLFLSEYCAQLPLHSEFHRAAAGPFDSQALYGIESQLQKNKWFTKVKGESRAYARMANSDCYKSYIATNFDGKQKNEIDRLIRLFKTARTIQCEIVATLYGAWNDFLIDGIRPTDEQIVDEVLTNWHESKERIEHDRWLTALEWMRQNGIIPTGYGISTKQDAK